MRAIGSMASGLKRVAAVIALAAGVLTAGALAATPAAADDGWRGHHRHHKHHWHHKHHRHHHHHRGGRAYFSYGPPVYYAPPPVYYAPPPVYYAPRVYAPPPSLSLGLSFPLR